MTFHVYQDLLGYGAVAWDGNFNGEAKEGSTLMANLKDEGKKMGDSVGRTQGEATLSRKKEVEWKITLQTSATHHRLEKIPEVISAGSMDATMWPKDNEWVCVFTLSK